MCRGGGWSAFATVAHGGSNKQAKLQLDYLDRLCCSLDKSLPTSTVTCPRNQTFQEFNTRHATPPAAVAARTVGVGPAPWKLAAASCAHGSGCVNSARKQLFRAPQAFVCQH